MLKILPPAVIASGVALLAMAVTVRGRGRDGSAAVPPMANVSSRPYERVLREKAPPQPAITETYCWPSIEYVIGGATMPVVAHDDQTFSPVVAL